MRVCGVCVIHVNRFYSCTQMRGIKNILSPYFSSLLLLGESRPLHGRLRLWWTGSRPPTPLPAGSAWHEPNSRRGETVAAGPPLLAPAESAQAGRTWCLGHAVLLAEAASWPTLLLRCRAPPAAPRSVSSSIYGAASSSTSGTASNRAGMEYAESRLERLLVAPPFGKLNG